MYRSASQAHTSGASKIKIFFFHAEDGIRDWSVTGVQTCALPILTVFHLERDHHHRHLQTHIHTETNRGSRALLEAIHEPEQQRCRGKWFYSKLHDIYHGMP